jgi:uncharacterized protein YgbK (DUF1537 family)
VTAIRILADDLTGALDAAAPFARRHGPLPVLWQLERGRTGSFALDTETRTRKRADWAACWQACLAGADLVLKKIDSLLRDRTAEEIAACWQSGQFASALIAPAFPAQQRITCGGRQLWRAAPGQPWQAVPCDLVAKLRARGVPLRLAASAADLPERGIVLCDAASEAELAALVAAGAGLAAPRLWCGSAGLARALAGSASETAEPPALPALPAPLLLIAGTRHGVTLRQIAALAPGLVSRIAARTRRAQADVQAEVAARLAAGQSAALVFDLPEGTAADAAAATIGATFAGLAERLPRPASLVVTGGSTLVRLMRALHARALLVEGELLPGVPRATIKGGPWAGAALVSKSGAFGAPDLLARLAAAADRAAAG